MPGRLVQDGRTIAFVPDEPLARASEYRLTVRHGLPLAGTSMTLEDDVVITIQTEGRVDPKIHIAFDRDLVETATADRAIFGVWLDRNLDEGERAKDYPLPKSLEVTVHRVGDVDAAVDAWRTIEDHAGWQLSPGATAVDTTALTRVMEATVKLRRFAPDEAWQQWFRLPRTLPAGWYVATISLGGETSQAILQVTDVAVYVVASQTRSAVWVNDLQAKGPLEGASVGLTGAALGRTGADGLLIAQTPDRMLHPKDGDKAPVAIVRDGQRAAFVPAGQLDCEKCDAERTDPWWRLFELDRYVYRTNDTISAWGVLRDRSTGRPPASVTVRLTSWDDDGNVMADINNATATPDASGAFLVKLPLRGAPDGDYEVEVLVGGSVVAQQSLSVGPIVKPAWTLELSSTRHAILVGSKVTIRATATFYEGTPVAGMKLNLTESDKTKRVTTNLQGLAITTLRIRHDRGSEGPSEPWRTADIWANPVDPESGQIEDSTDVVVFQSNIITKVDATVTSGRLKVAGTAHDVAWARYETADPQDLWTVEPYGRLRSGIAVRIHVVEHSTKRVRAGTDYDFITKQSIPKYRYVDRKVDLGTWRVRTDGAGRYRLSIPVAGTARTYEVIVDAKDAAGRSATVGAWATVPDTYDEPLPRAWIESRDHAGPDGETLPYSVGQPVNLDFTGGSGRTTASRYLWTVAASGLQAASVTKGPQFADTFRAAWVPGVIVNAVRFTGAGYEVAESGFGLAFNTEDRRLTVKLTPDKARYRPGGKATVAIRVTDQSGKGVKASVYLRAIDEKLFSLDMADVTDPIDAIYNDPGSGILGISWTHFDPRPTGGGDGGDTTGGGGDRTDFRDWLLSRIVRTGADGRASATFDISDDLTSWRIVGEAVTASLLAGVGQASIPVSIPFFADLTIAPEYLVSDRPVIRVRGFGGGLGPDDTVRYTISSDTLPMAATTVTAKAFRPAEIALPRLSVGAHRVRVAASVGSGAARQTDALVGTFTVVRSRSVQARDDHVTAHRGRPP